LWRTSKGASPIRDLSNVGLHRGGGRRLQVIAIQEMRESAQSFGAMLLGVGSGWAFLIADVTQRAGGDNERLAFVFDTGTANLSALACELLVTADHAASRRTRWPVTSPAPLRRGFPPRQRPVHLVTPARGLRHGAGPPHPGVTGIARWLTDWAASRVISGTNMIALGHVNLDRQGDPFCDAFTSIGLRPPDPLNFVPRIVFDDPDQAAPPDHRHFYDQIAWFPNTSLREDHHTSAGMLDGNTGLVPVDTTLQLFWRSSHHLPLWCEFTLAP
jgi:hypothetical protein